MVENEIKEAKESIAPVLIALFFLILAAVLTIIGFFYLTIFAVRDYLLV